MTSLLSYLVDVSPAAAILVKGTILLLAGWLLHRALMDRNPRWRILIWRTVIVGLVLIPLGEYLAPKLLIAVERTQPVSVVQQAHRAIIDGNVIDAANDVAPIIQEDSPTQRATQRAELSPPNSILGTTGPSSHWFDQYAFVILGGLWSVVFAVLTLRMAVTYWRMWREVATAQPASDALQTELDRVRYNLGIQQTVALRVSTTHCSPYLAGIRKPVVVLPRALTTVEHRTARPAVFAHELAHLAARDPLWLLLSRLAANLWWFHSLVWRMGSALAASCEEVSDAVAAQYVGGEPRYSRQLASLALQFVALRPLPAGVAMIRTAQITRRLKRLSRGISYRALSRRKIAAAVLSMGLLLGGLTALQVTGAEQAASEQTVAKNKAAPVEENLLEQPIRDDELAGTIVDEQGRPIADALVDVFTWFPGHETKTNNQGQFRLSGFNEDFDQPFVQVQFSKPGCSPQMIADQPVGKQLKITLHDKTYFTGQVLDPSGKPVPDAKIRARRHIVMDDGGARGDLWTETTADDQGRYKLFVEADQYDIQVSAPGAGVKRLAQETIGVRQARQLDIKLEEGVTFRAKVVDSQTGQPIAGIYLWHFQHPGIQGVSDAQGQIVIPAMQPGKFEFQVTDHDIWSTAQDFLSGRITMQQMMSRDMPRDADGYARWWSDQCANQWSRFQEDSTRDGWQRNFDNLDFELKVGMDPVVIEMEKAARIRGKVIDPDGNPVAGATVAPANGRGNSITGDTRFSFRTAADGTFEMVLPASKKAIYNLVAHDGKFLQWRNWANGISEPLSTQPGEVVEDVVLQLTRPATVKGRVVDAQGQPVANAVVRAKPDDGRNNRYYDPETKTNDQGEFTLKYIRSGETTIHASPTGTHILLPGSQHQLTLAPGEMREGVKIQLQPAKVFTPVENLSK